MRATHERTGGWRTSRGRRDVGQAQPPVSAETQQLNLQQSAVATAGGTATFTFPNPPTGLAFTGTLSCANAPTAAQFVAMIGATQWGDWAGNSVAGPIQARAGQQLVVTASGLVAGVTYELTWIGSSDNEPNVQPIFPEPNTSSLEAAISGPVQSQGIVDKLASGSTALVAGTSVSLPSSAGVTALHAYQALLLVGTFGPAPPNAIFASALAIPAAGGGLVLTFPSIPLYPNGPAADDVAVLPVACQAGDAVGMDVVATASGTFNWVLFGYTQALQTVPLRSDGRAMPMGTRAASVFPAAGAGATIVAAPTAPFRILVNTLQVASSAGAFIVAGTINGVGVQLAQSTGGINLYALPIPPAGLLLDPATALVLNASAGATQSAMCTYDLVA